MANNEHNTKDDMSDKFKNKSTLIDSLLGRVKTDEFDNYYENIQTRVSNDISKHKKIFHNMIHHCYWKKSIHYHLQIRLQ